MEVALTPRDYEQRPWWPEGGPTAFQPFAADTEYFGKAEQAFFITALCAFIGGLVLFLLEIRAATASLRFGSATAE